MSKVKDGIQAVITIGLLYLITVTIVLIVIVGGFIMLPWWDGSKWLLRKILR